jgi:CDP-4-dehydro-6-deoxyglucose reductase, E3
MKRLTFNAQTFDLTDHESVLDCLLRNGQAIPYACKAGMCQACLVKAVDCEATEESRKWIKPALQAQGYTLACQWVPQSDAAIMLPRVEDFSVATRIHQLELLTPRIMRLLLEVSEPARMPACRPGQYLSLINPAGTSRPYSIANDFALEGFLEFHISHTTHGEFTHWLFNAARPGHILHVRGPAGDCYYHEVEDAEHPLLLAGTGSGLAPLYGVLRDALQKGHTAPIALYHGGRSKDHLYLVETLQTLAANHDNFSYHPCTIQDEAAAGFHVGPLEQILGRHLQASVAAQSRAYLCGAPDLVHKLRKQLFLGGVKAGNIHCDPFTERTVVNPASSQAES